MFDRQTSTFYQPALLAGSTSLLVRTTGSHCTYVCKSLFHTERRVRNSCEKDFQFQQEITIVVVD
jgi:hypothetical protein